MFCGLPKTGIVCLYSVFPAGGETELAELAKCFRKAGYDVREKPNATLDDLRSIPKDCSVFYFNTHGVYYPIKETNKETNEEVIIKKDFIALQTGTMYDRAVHPKDPDSALLGAAGVAGTAEQYITISYPFIEKHWRFSDNSFVFINGCHAFDGEDKDSLWHILLNKCNASVMAGWTHGNVSNCASTNLYLFDRLLGSNFPMAQQEYPPQRPFDLDSVFKKLDTPIGSSKMTEVLVNLEDGKQGHSLLRIKRSGKGDFGILAPSIKEVTIDEDEKRLSISGYFGEDQEKLRIFLRETMEKQACGGEVELFREKSEDPNEIKCSGLKDSGPGSAGYLVVAADYGNGILVESNPVPITAWTGNLDFSITQRGKNQQGTVVGSITGEVFLRGDIHRPRTQPGGDLQRPWCAFRNVFNPGKPPQYYGGGEYVSRDTGYKYVWKGSGAMNSLESRVFDIVCWHRHPGGAAHPKLFVNLSTATEDVLLNVWDKKGKKIISDNFCPIMSASVAWPPRKDKKYGTEFLRDSLSWSENGRNYESSYDIAIDPIKGTATFFMFPDEGDKSFVGRMQWTALKAKYAPDDSTPG